MIREGGPYHVIGYPISGVMPPTPIRKKAFYRALRAKKLWVIAPYSAVNSRLESRFAQVIYDKYVDSGFMYITWPLDYNQLRW